MKDSGQPSGAFSEEEIASIARRFLPLVERELAEERARQLWDSLMEYYPLSLKEKRRFVMDKAADFLRTSTAKDRRDILAAISSELRRPRPSL